MPQNTPTIYLIGALIAVAGVLVGSLGQVGTAALQRRHERRLKLDDVRRVTYADMLSVLQRSAASIIEIAAAADDLRRQREEMGRKGEIYAPATGLDRSKRALSERHELEARRTELSSTIALIAGKKVQRELGPAMRKAASKAFRLEDVTPFVNACRRELGARGEYVMLTPSEASPSEPERPSAPEPR